MGNSLGENIDYGQSNVEILKLGQVVLFVHEEWGVNDTESCENLWTIIFLFFYIKWQLPWTMKEL